MAGSGDETGTRFLFDCIQNGDAESLLDLVSNGADINVKNKEGQTPLHVASVDGKVELVTALLNLKADVNVRNNEGQTPLHVASLHGKVELVTALLKLRFNFAAMDSLRRNSLHLACSQGHEAVVQKILQHTCIPKVWTNISDALGEYPLHYASRIGSVEMVRLLITYGAETDTCNKLGRRPLSEACLFGHYDVVQVLLHNLSQLTLQCQRHLLRFAVERCSLGFLRQILSQWCIDVHTEIDEGKTALHLAASRTENIHIVKFLVERGVTINYRDCSGETPLHKSCLAGDVDIVDFLLQKRACVNLAHYIAVPASPSGYAVVDVRDNEHGPDVTHNSPLHYACMINSFEIVNTLVRYEANINARNDKSETPLHLASGIKDSKAVVRLLLDKGAEVNAVCFNQMTPLLQACRDSNGPVIDLLMERGADMKATTPGLLSPLHLAVVGQNHNLVLLWITKNADINATDEHGATPLHLASERASVEIVETLLRGGAAVNATNRSRTTPLHLAVREGNLHIVHFLLDFRAQADVYDEERKCPLFLACFHSWYDIIKVLLQQAPHRNSKTSVESLLWAVVKGKVEVVKLLLKYGVDTDIRDDHGNTPLHVSCATGNVEIIKLLLVDYGADINIENGQQVNALRQSCAVGNVDVVDFLLQKRARIGTALFTAMYYRHAEIVKKLVLHGADVNMSFQSFNPLYFACFMDLHDILEVLLLNGADTNARVNYQNTPLHLAASRVGNNAMAELLIDFGADMDSRNIEGRTALHTASYFSDRHMVDLLLRRGANVNAEDELGMTPLHRVCMAPDRDIAQSLITHGASVNARSWYNGTTPLHEAVRSGVTAIVIRLLNAGAWTDVRDGLSNTPLALARMQNHRHLYRLLQNARR